MSPIGHHDRPPFGPTVANGALSDRLAELPTLCIETSPNLRDDAAVSIEVELVRSAGGGIP